MRHIIKDDFSCVFCNEILEEIFIKCEECHEKPQICLECFSNGLENEQHRNDHAYRVINLKNFATFQEWNVYDEIQLNLKASSNKLAELEQTTITNEEKPRFEPSETRLKHLESWFDLFEVSNNSKLTRKHKKSRLRSTMVLYKEPNVNNQTDISLNLNSIRPAVHSKLYRLMSGYRAARGDFETESRENFEFKHIADMDYGQINDLSSYECNLIDDDINVDSIDDDSFVNAFKVSALGSYKNLIRERYEKKKFIREFGLLPDLIEKSIGLKSSFPIGAAKPSSIQYLPQLRPGEQLCTATDNISHLRKLNTDSVHYWNLPSKFITLFSDYESYAKSSELLNHFGYLKQRLEELREYRSQGLRSLKHVSIYNTYKLKRLNRVSTCHMASLFTYLSRVDLAEQQSQEGCREQQLRDWFRRFVVSERALLTSSTNGDNGESKETTATVNTPASATETSAPLCYPASQMKYKNNPLRIEEYPESDKLDEDEKEFCRVARIQPVVYLRVKGVLIAENKKAGFCTYARARKIAGIDVNKCRLIHTLLLKLNLISAVLTKKEPVNN